MTTDLRGTDAVGSARERRSDLHSALVALEAALAAPRPGRAAAWTDGVRVALVRVRDAFDAHVLGAESPDGLFEDVVLRAPRLATAVRRLADEHPTISAALDRAFALLGDAGDVDAEGVREATLVLLGLLARHRQRGADLVYEVYAVDIGGME